MNETTNTRLFEGKSSNGDIHEALENAVMSAKEGLTTDFVEWTLSNISGRYGGYIIARDLTITIKAKPYQSSEDAVDGGELPRGI